VGQDGAQASVKGQNNMTRVLIVDDEAPLVDLLRRYLVREGYEITTACTGREALQQVQASEPEVIILDVMLPELDGIEVCRQLRRFSDAYVLMLTARAEELDKIIGLSVGADDYLTKPFSPNELIARVKALLRRPRQHATPHSAPTNAPGAPTPQEGELRIDAARHDVLLRGHEIVMTAREFELLLLLSQQPGRVFTRAQLLEQVWGDAYYDDHVVDVHIANLRRKLGESSTEPHYIETVRGVGYRFRRV